MRAFKHPCSNAVFLRGTQEHPEVKKVSDIARIAGEAWRAMAPDDKARFVHLSATEKVRFQSLHPHA